MNLSFNWLGDFVDVDKLPAPKQYCDRMTDTGSKVEGYEVLGADIHDVLGLTDTVVELDRKSVV